MARGDELAQVDKMVTRERERIAQELHDGVAQSLYSIALASHLCRTLLQDDVPGAQRKLGQLENLANETIKELRSEIFDLRAPIAEQTGLSETIEAYVRRFENVTGLRASYETRGKEKNVEPAAVHSLACVVREALANIERHARASDVAVRLDYQQSELELSILDDGIGFDPAAPESRDERHIGLIGMERRVDALGGVFTILTRPGAGTHIRISCPYDAIVPGET